MTSARVDLAAAFADSIYPGFPFRNRAWRAVAFERNRYDNTRMPEHFFRLASDVFNPGKDQKLLVWGDCFLLDGRHETASIDFDWQRYRTFMYSPEGFSLEYKMISDDGACAIWVDPELTVFGGAPDQMAALLDALGGAEATLQQMEQAFYFGDSNGNEDLRDYLRGLVCPERRGADK